MFVRLLRIDPPDERIYCVSPLTTLYIRPAALRREQGHSFVVVPAVAPCIHVFSRSERGDFGIISCISLQTFVNDRKVAADVAHALQDDDTLQFGHGTNDLIRCEHDQLAT